MQGDWSEAPSIKGFYGREKELAELKQWITNDQCGAVMVSGIGGIGKTTLVAVATEQVQDQFDYVLWYSLQNRPPLKDIIERCIPHFSSQVTNDFPKDVVNLISLLLEYLQRYRCLLVLDNVETVLPGSRGISHYRSGYGEYGRLIRCFVEAQHHSCLLLMGREKLNENKRTGGKALRFQSIHLDAIRPSETYEFLREKGLFGLDAAFTNLVHLCLGNPLALELACETLRENFEGDISELLKREGKGTIHDFLDQHFDHLSRLELEVIYWLAIERVAVSPDHLQKDLAYPVLRMELLEALDSLRRRSLIEMSSMGNFKLQPVIMEYVTSTFVKQVSEEVVTGSVRLFGSHALMKPQAKDYVRESQIRFILKPVTERLLPLLGKKGVEERLKSILLMLRETNLQHLNYVAGNVLNLLALLGSDICDNDFLHLMEWRAYRQIVDLPEDNVSPAYLTNSAFTETFGSVLSVAFSSKDDLLVAGTSDGGVRLWRFSNGWLLLTLLGHTDWVRSVAFSPDDTTLASGSDDRTVRLWEVSSGQCLKILKGHTSWVSSVAFSPDGKLIASTSNDRLVRLWEVSSGQCLKILKGHTSWVSSVAFSPDGTTLASGSDDRTVRLWEVSSGQCLKILKGHTSWIYSVAFSPDGKLIASGGEDRAMRLWEVSNGQCLKTFPQLINWICSVTFNHDGSILASGGEDRLVRLWEPSSGRCFGILRGHSGWIRSVAFSPDGSIIASGGDDGTIRLWNAQTDQCFQMMRRDKLQECMNTTRTKGLADHQKTIFEMLKVIEDQSKK